MTANLCHEEIWDGSWAVHVFQWGISAPSWSLSSYRGFVSSERPPAAHSSLCHLSYTQQYLAHREQPLPALLLCPLWSRWWHGTGAGHRQPARLCWGHVQREITSDSVFPRSPALSYSILGLVPFILCHFKLLNRNIFGGKKKIKTNWRCHLHFASFCHSKQCSKGKERYWG